MTFNGFDPDAIALLAEMPGWGADTYAAHKGQLKAGISTPGLALITDLADCVGRDLSVVARSSVSPLHRDLRFAPADSPRYKDHLLLTTWEGKAKATAPTLWIRIDATRAGFASGIGFTPAVRERWREKVADDAGHGLRVLLDELVADRAAEIAGDRLRKVPPPHPGDHPRADLLRLKGFQVRFTESLPPSIADPQCAGWFLEHLEALLGVHRWLVEHVATD